MSTSATELRMLGAVRILFGALVLLRTTPVLSPLHVSYLRETSPLLGWPTPAWHVAAGGLALPAGIVAALCVARTVALVLFTIGIHARASGIAAGVLAWLVLAQDATGYINTFTLLFLGLIVLGMSGAGSACALRAEPDDDPHSGLALTRAFVVSVYAWSGFAKLNASWLSGEVLDQLHASGVVGGPLSDAMLSSATGCAVVATVIAATELSMGPLLLWIPTRRAAVVAALIFHAALQVSVNPDFFGLAMVILLLAFVGHGEAPRRRLPRERPDRPTAPSGTMGPSGAIRTHLESTGTCKRAPSFAMCKARKCTDRRRSTLATPSLHTWTLEADTLRYRRGRRRCRLAEADRVPRGLSASTPRHSSTRRRRSPHRRAHRRCPKRRRSWRRPGCSRR
jgi:hypothetical protein